MKSCISLFQKRIFKKFLTPIITIILILSLVVLSINIYITAKTKDNVIPYNTATTLEDVDCIIVLGCYVKPDGSPSNMLHDRLDYGCNLYHDGAAPKLLMSGDHGTAEYDEVNNMKEFAINQGIPSEDVFMDHAGFSTYDSIYRARDIFCCDKIIIVTQEYHLYRALYIAESLGIEAYGVASDPRKYVGQWTRDLREVAARTKDFFMVTFDADPVVLGDSIPISGNGELTSG